MQAGERAEPARSRRLDGRAKTLDDGVRPSRSRRPPPRRSGARSPRFESTVAYSLCRGRAVPAHELDARSAPARADRAGRGRLRRACANARQARAAGARLANRALRARHRCSSWSRSRPRSRRSPRRSSSRSTWRSTCLLGDLAPLCLLAGLTGPILRPLLALPGVMRLRVLANPLVALPIWAANLALWHVPRSTRQRSRTSGVHASSTSRSSRPGSSSGSRCWRRCPRPSGSARGAKLGYIVGVRLVAHRSLGNVFIWGGSPFYDVYETGDDYLGLSPQADQSLAGSLMMLEGSLVTIVAIAWLFLRMAQEGEIRQELLEQRPRSAGRAPRGPLPPLARVSKEARHDEPHRPPPAIDLVRLVDRAQPAVSTASSSSRSVTRASAAGRRRAAVRRSGTSSARRSP